eukprot:TRINITY_DN2798_c0_g1_i1.p1 TRINITY_DN2798_c0_g1~~TRINITY_DN2798_c0_g1_i1.p1  ORF type:complete len:173 (-),score=18.85 TRINITY_DN2798_c0_g1_i1:44-541(-)
MAEKKVNPLGQSIRVKPSVKRNEMVDFVYKACHIWSQRQPELAYEVLHPELKEHSWNVQGIKEIQEICYAMHDAFTGYHLDIEDVIAEGNLENGKVCARFTAHGKWVNPYCGVDPSNEEVCFPGTLTWLIKDKKVTDSWIFQSYADAPELGYAVLKLSHDNGAYC